MQIWIVVYATGAVQAALLALALGRRQTNAQANLVLALWVAIVGFDLAVKAVFLSEPGSGLFKTYRFVALFPFLYGSLFYVYVRASVTARGLTLRDLVHAAGFAAALLWTAPLLLADPAETAAAFQRWYAGQWSSPSPWYDFFLFGYSLAYLTAALWRIHRYRRAVIEQRSDNHRRPLRWMEAMAIGQIIIWCLAALHWTLRLPHVDYFLVYGAVAAWICMIGWFSLAQPPTIPLAFETRATLPLQTADDSRYPAVEARLSELMQRDAIYREPALTIGQLAKRSGYPEYLVSEVINRRLGVAFWDYVNRQRVDAACVHLSDPSDARTVLDIAYDCGFTSKSTFNAAFKRELGETPSAYRRRIAQGDTASKARTPAG